MNENEKTPLLEIKNLSVEYRTDIETVKAVNDITLTLNERETLGLVGETGAGKTTTALAVMRLLPDLVAKVTGGQIIFKGRDLLKIKESEMRNIRGEFISMIFQDPMTSLNPIMTVGDQVKEAVMLHSENKHDKAAINHRAEEVLQLVGIPRERIKEYPHQFSGGMKQRVVIAMALACEPELIIADEPTTALDVTIQAQVLALIKNLKKKFGTSMLLITHDLGVIAQTSDKVAVMYAGRIVEAGTVFELFDNNIHHPYTEGLFGSIPNLEKKTDRLSPIKGSMPDPTNLPEGCSFAVRCPHCMDICKKAQPPLWKEGSHQISCFLYAQERGQTNE